MSDNEELTFGYFYTKSHVENITAEYYFQIFRAKMGGYDGSANKTILDRAEMIRDSDFQIVG